jgi:hypothetical protein
MKTETSRNLAQSVSQIVADHGLHDVLEGLIDQHGLPLILLSLSEICGEKADHLESQWGGDSLAVRKWQRLSRKIERIA